MTPINTVPNYDANLHLGWLAPIDLDQYAYLRDKAAGEGCTVAEVLRGLIMLDMAGPDEPLEAGQGEEPTPSLLSSSAL